MESLYFHPEEEGIDVEDSTTFSGPPSKSQDNEGEETKNNENDD